MPKIELIQGDCLEKMKDIPDKSIDMILCDLPYGTTACKWDSIIPFEPLWEQYERIIKDNGAIVLFGSEPFTSFLVMSNLKMFKYCWYWKKNNHSNPFLAKTQPLRIVEDILVFYKKLPTYNRNTQATNKISRSCNSQNYGGRESVVYTQTETGYPKNLLEFNSETGLHPTQKPVALLEYLIKTYTNEGETVLDNCMGSGTTAVACINTNRNFIGIELDPEYFKIAEKRINENL
jgi:site-specific DNA-methyltransferase (adenine-specific)